MSSEEAENPLSPEELEERIVGLLMGELDAEATQKIEVAIAGDENLQKFHQRMQMTLGFVQEAVHTSEVSNSAPLRLSEDRRAALFEKMRVVEISKTEGYKRWWTRKRVERLAVAATIVVIFGILAGLTMPALKNVSMGDVALMEPSAPPAVLPYDASHSSFVVDEHLDRDDVEEYGIVVGVNGTGIDSKYSTLVGRNITSTSLSLKKDDHSAFAVVEQKQSAEEMGEVDRMARLENGTFVSHGVSRGLAGHGRESAESQRLTGALGKKDLALKQRLNMKIVLPSWEGGDKQALSVDAPMLAGIVPASPSGSTFWSSSGFGNQPSVESQRHDYFLDINSGVGNSLTVAPKGIQQMDYGFKESSSRSARIDEAALSSPIASGSFRFNVPAVKSEVMVASGVESKKLIRSVNDGKFSVADLDFSTVDALALAAKAKQENRFVEGLGINGVLFRSPQKRLKKKNRSLSELSSGELAATVDSKMPAQKRGYREQAGQLGLPEPAGAKSFAYSWGGQAAGQAGGGLGGGAALDAIIVGGSERKRGSTIREVWSEPNVTSQAREKSSLVANDDFMLGIQVPAKNIQVWKDGVRNAPRQVARMIVSAESASPSVAVVSMPHGETEEVQIKLSEAFARSSAEGREETQANRSSGRGGAGRRGMGLPSEPMVLEARLGQRAPGPQPTTELAPSQRGRLRGQLREALPKASKPADRGRSTEHLRDELKSLVVLSDSIDPFAGSSDRQLQRQAARLEGEAGGEKLGRLAAVQVATSGPISASSPANPRFAKGFGSKDSLGHNLSADFAAKDNGAIFLSIPVPEEGSDAEGVSLNGDLSNYRLKASADSPRKAARLSKSLLRPPSVTNYETDSKSRSTHWAFGVDRDGDGIVPLTDSLDGRQVVSDLNETAQKWNLQPGATVQTASDDLAQAERNVDRLFFSGTTRSEAEQPKEIAEGFALGYAGKSLALGSVSGAPATMNDYVDFDTAAEARVKARITDSRLGDRGGVEENHRTLFDVETATSGKPSDTTLEYSDGQNISAFYKSRLGVGQGQVLRGMAGADKNGDLVLEHLVELRQRMSVEAELEPLSQLLEEAKRTIAGTSGYARFDRGDLKKEKVAKDANKELERKMLFEISKTAAPAYPTAPRALLSQLSSRDGTAGLVRGKTSVVLVDEDAEIEDGMKVENDSRKIVVGGRFEAINGRARNRFARLTTNSVITRDDSSSKDLSAPLGVLGGRQITVKRNGGSSSTVTVNATSELGRRAAPELSKPKSTAPQKLRRLVSAPSSEDDEEDEFEDTEPPTPVLPKKPKTLKPKPEVLTKDNAFSTFSLNVSDVAFKLAVASLNQGKLPEPDTVRSEEFLNALNYHDSAPTGNEKLAFAWERARNPFAHNRDLLRFSVQTAARGREAGQPLNLVVLLDASGSMERPDRVKIVREMLAVLAGQLKPQDKISVVAFARTPWLLVDGMAGGNPKEFLKRILNITPQGGTNLETGLDTAYAIARRHFKAKGNNRVIVLTDGAANLGNIDPEQLKAKVETQRKRNIALDCFGVGWEGYNDTLLETLSRNGDGRYGFINDPVDARHGFANLLAGALQVAAANVKTQIEFNKDRVIAYRQIGYDKHQLKKEQFRDNTVDAAEIGAAESGTAMYSIQVNRQGRGPIGTVRVRYKVPATGRYIEEEWELAYDPVSVPLQEAKASMRLAAVASSFAEWMAANPHAGSVNLGDLQLYLSGVPEEFSNDERPKQLQRMLQQARRISGQ